MSIETTKIMNLADGKVLYDDLRGRVDAKYTKPVSGIPGTDIASGVIPVLTELIDDTSGDGDTNVTWSADKSHDEIDAVVVASETQPQQAGNKLWIEEDSEEEYSIPTSAEMTAGLAAKVNKPSSEGTSGQVLRTNGNGSTYWDDDANATDIANAVTDWLDTNVPTGTTVVVDSSLTVSGAAADSKKTGDELNGLKSAVRANPRIVVTEENGADLYISDADGYVVVQFSDGHIQTQKFDSSDIGELDDLETTDDSSIVDAINEVNSKIAKNVSTVELTNGTASLDIIDNSGYVIARFADGHFQTKNFNSSKVTYLHVE